ncbi:MAG TPA: glycoside hydrolase family 3 C-terminal domain-containing protein [Streptosporangiaceae bacterium]|nr:glycoside hydrolase family 3 C-terminal domain-containing protein [Streptosporangiaceae bacterium]
MARLRGRITVAAISAAALALLGAGLPAGHPGLAQAASSCPWVGSTASPDTKASEVLAQMTLSDEIALVHGVSGTYVGNVPANPRLCIPALGLEDGPAGVADGMTGVTQLPSPGAATATWDTALEQQYGAVVGAEEAGKGANINLGPTVNIVRDPRWGRAFESMGEDPYLAGQMAVADIQGVQSQNVMAQVKHLAVYNQETYRNTTNDNAIIDQRTMQEIYLPQFRAAVQQGGASSVMCSYSMINSVFACENPYTMEGVLKTEFGFPGFVTSDWGATHSTVPSANSGLDMEMPTGKYFSSALSTAVTNGQVNKARLDDMVHRILRQMFLFGLFDRAPSGSPTATVTTPAHAAVARQTAEEGAVLLKNAGGILPLSTSSLHSIAVIGSDASSGAYTAGGGSANVKAPYVVNPLQGITNRATGVTVNYDSGSSTTRAASLAKKSDVAIVFADDPESEGSDLSNIDLPGSQNNLISAVAAVNPRTIVVLNTGSAVTMPWLSQVAGVFEAWYPGQEDGNAIAALLFGDVNPSGKLPVTFPQSLADVPASTTAQWPGTNGQVQYSEGVNVGYRWYQAKNITPLFPFGYGLSYTTFALSNLAVSGTDGRGDATVSATVTNTGSRAGADVAQLYVGDPATGEPPKQLKGFSRVDLAPGASQTVQFTLTPHDLAYWDDASGSWQTPAGTYQIWVGDSSANLPLNAALSVTTGSGPAAGPVTGVSGLCVTDQGGSSANGTPIQLAACNGSTAQQWTVANDGTLRALGKCLDVTGGNIAGGTAVQLYDCNASGAQVWQPQANGELLNPSSGRCLDDPGGSTTGAQLQIADCAGTAEQTWTLP